MDFTLKAIEEIHITNTQERILYILSINQKVNIKFLGDNINVLYATLCKELKKLHLKGVVEIVETNISLTHFGNTMINFNKFKCSVMTEFCELNNINKNAYDLFINNKNYNNMKLLLGIKNLSKKKSN